MVVSKARIKVLITASNLSIGSICKCSGCSWLVYLILLAEAFIISHFKWSVYYLAPHLARILSLEYFAVVRTGIGRVSWDHVAFFAESRAPGSNSYLTSSMLTS